mmetsp:Transcript_63127/g.185174  ORF Transcript_63127/g.185174 Transcript_63127/m.185174 type:complete len:376 (+) Transcript_63127:412-1539(+)
MPSRRPRPRPDAVSRLRGPRLGSHGPRGDHPLLEHPARRRHAPRGCQSVPGPPHLARTVNRMVGSGEISDVPQGPLALALSSLLLALVQLRLPNEGAPHSETNLSLPDPPVEDGELQACLRQTLLVEAHDLHKAYRAGHGRVPEHLRGQDHVLAEDGIPPEHLSTLDARTTDDDEEGIIIHDQLVGAEQGSPELVGELREDGLGQIPQVPDAVADLVDARLDRQLALQPIGEPLQGRLVVQPPLDVERLVNVPADAIPQRVGQLLLYHELVDIVHARVEGRAKLVEAGEHIDDRTHHVGPCDACDEYREDHGDDLRLVARREVAEAHCCEHDRDEVGGYFVHFEGGHVLRAALCLLQVSRQPGCPAFFFIDVHVA